MQHGVEEHPVPICEKFGVYRDRAITTRYSVLGPPRERHPLRASHRSFLDAGDLRFRPPVRGHAIVEPYPAELGTARRPLVWHPTY